MTNENSHAPLRARGAVAFPAAGPGHYVKIPNTFLEECEGRYGDEWFWKGLNDLNVIKPSDQTKLLRRFCFTAGNKLFEGSFGDLDVGPADIVAALQDAMFLSVHRMTGEEWKAEQARLLKEQEERPSLESGEDPQGQDHSSETSSDQPSEQAAGPASSGRSPRRKATSTSKSESAPES